MDNNNDLNIIFECINKNKNINSIINKINKLDVSEINKENADGETLLICACNNYLFEVVIALLNKGADINISDKYYDTPLLICIEHLRNIMNIPVRCERSKKIPLRIDINNPVRCGGRSKNIPLRIEILNNIINELLKPEYNINVGYQNAEQDTALILACKYSMKDIAEKLLHSYKYKNNIGYCNIYGHSAFTYASCNMIDVAMDLLELDPFIVHHHYSMRFINDQSNINLRNKFENIKNLMYVLLDPLLYVIMMIPNIEANLVCEIGDWFTDYLLERELLLL